MSINRPDDDDDDDEDEKSNDDWCEANSNVRSEFITSLVSE